MDINSNYMAPERTITYAFSLGSVQYAFGRAPHGIDLNAFNEIKNCELLTQASVRSVNCQLIAR